MERRVPSKLNTQVYEEACEWFVESRAGELDEAARRELDHWLRKSPEHLGAYLEVAALWNEGPGLDPQRQWDVDTLIAQAAADRSNVVPLSESARGSPRHLPSAERRPHIFAIAAALAMIAIVAGGLAWWQLNGVPAYATQLGEQRSIALADGSTVELNSRSKIKVRYAEHERAIELLEGQALFRVAKDAARPFVVTSGSTRVRAVGTQFDVYKKESGTVVTVVEGRVEILTPGVHAASGSGVDLLSAGEQLTVTRDAIQRTPRPSIASATAWTQRQLVFEAASLSQVAEEFNRYNQRQLIVEDAELYDFHISGVFSSTDPASLIRFLRARPGVEVIENASEIRVTKKQP